MCPLCRPGRDYCGTRRRSVHSWGHPKPKTYLKKRIQRIHPDAMACAVATRSFMALPPPAKPAPHVPPTVR